MSGVAFLIEFLSGVALLLYAARMVRRAVDRAAGARIRRAIAHATKGRLRACATGTVAAVILQSSSATGLLAAGFAERGMLSLTAGLALMLGADLGSSLVAQALAIKTPLLGEALLLIGACIAMMARSRHARQWGKAILGVALILLSLDRIVSVSMSLGNSNVFVEIAEAVAGMPVIALLAGALLAWLAHSSIATILLVSFLATSGAIPAPLGAALVLGANLGSGLVPLAAGSQLGAEAKRVLVGNLGFRLIAALAGLGALVFAPDLLTLPGADPARQLLNLHLAFNVVLVVMFLPLLGPAGRILQGMFGNSGKSGVQVFSKLQGTDVNRPALAIAAAQREIIRLADTVELMLSEALLAFRDNDLERCERISRLDNEVDRLQDEIKLFLSRLLRGDLEDRHRRECGDLLQFTTNLEHVGDAIDGGLLKLAAKRQRNGVEFSEAGWREIEALHGRAVAQMRLAVAVFSTRDLSLAKELMAEKDDFRKLERAAVEKHFDRLKEGAPASIDTSDIHLDILRDLKRITAYLTSAAHPILETHGMLRNSRLIVE